MSRLSPRPPAIDPRNVPRSRTAAGIVSSLLLAALIGAFLFLLFYPHN